MDTLVSLAVTASFCWSLYALFFGGAGSGRDADAVRVHLHRGQRQTLYLEAAAGVTAAVLAGRYLEARARDRRRPR